MVLNFSPGRFFLPINFLFWMFIQGMKSEKFIRINTSQATIVFTFIIPYLIFQVSQWRRWSSIKMPLMCYVEIYLIACLIDYLSTVSTYVEWVQRKTFWLDIDARIFFHRDRTAINYGENILSFRAIFNDVRNSVERVHMKVNTSSILKKSKHAIQCVLFQGKLKEMVCEDIEKYIHKDPQLPVLLDR